MKHKIIPFIAGAAALLLMVVLYGSAVRQDQAAAPVVETTAAGQQSLVIDTPEMVYDGYTALNLMDGVTATNVDGQDITSQVNAVITGRGSMNRKIVRYSVFTSAGEELTGERTLVMKNYTGPQIYITGPLELTAQDLSNLVFVLQERGQIQADDGFGQDVTDQVTWVRQRQSMGNYEITFGLTNAYLDTATVDVQAAVTGDVSDITLTLTQNNVEIPRGSEFIPQSYIAEATDPAVGSIADRVQVTGTVNVNTPGDYSVVYTVYSLDTTQVARALLHVRVTGDANG